MAFVVEDGTGLSTANSYLSRDDFKAYHKDRGTDVSAFSGAEMDDALVKSSDYMDRRYRGRFIGNKKNRDRSAGTTTPAQRLAWPRINAVDVSGAWIDMDSVPIEIEEACAEYAFRALSETLAPDPPLSATGAPVILSRTKVGPIETEVEYAEGGQTLTFREYPEVDAILRGLIVAKGRTFR